MNKSSKICFSIVAVVLCFAMLLIVPMVTKANTEPTLVVSSAEACAGEDVQVTVSMRNNPGIICMKLDIEYDTSVLTLKQVEDTGLLAGGMHTSNLSASPYPLTWANDLVTQDYVVNGDLVTLTFTVADDVSAKTVVDINLSYDNSKNAIYNFDTDLVDFAVENGTVTVDKMPTPIALDGGAVAIQSFGVDKTGDVPTSKVAAYEDYLFAGWFTSTECTKKNAITDTSKVASDSYAKFIPAEVLSVKGQVATDGSEVMRFVSSVDSLVYKNVGFEVVPEGGTKKTYQTSTVFERVNSTTDGVEYGFSSKVVDTASNYLVTAKLNAEEDIDYTVRVYVVTMDGQKVYGPARTIGLVDGRDANVLNLSYVSDSAPAVDAQIDVTYGSDDTATYAEVIGVDGKTVSVRVSVDGSTLPSATKFTFGDTGSTIFRNLYTKYTGTDTEDTTWYDVYLADNANETEFAIATNADMYGFMELYAGKNLFANKTLYVISDIAMNDNVTDTVVASWANGTEAPYKWNPSGDNASGTRFQGTFDGQMHTLSGFYVNEDNSDCANNKNAGTYVGMFGSIDLGGVVKNFYLTDSYMTTTGGTLSTSATGTMYAYLGSVAGENRGTIENIYSDAIVTSSGQRTGGIIGVLNTTVAVATAGKQAVIDNCWFDGEVRLLNDTGIVGGGVIGYVMQRESTMSNLLFTGTVTAATTGEACVGGLLGTEGGQSGELTNYINMEDCVSVGTVTAGEGATAVGTAIGKITQGASVHKMVNVYADSAKGSLVGTGTADYPGMSLAVESLYGTDIYRNTLLDVNNTWYARTDDSPVLRTFTEKYDVNNVVTDFSGIEQDNWYSDSTKGYCIYTASAFRKFSEYSNSSIYFSGMLVYLGADIDLNPGWIAPTDSTTEVTGAEAFTPIGRNKPTGTSGGFKGTFDGRYHEISGLYVNITSGMQAALFAEIDGSAVVKNFSLINSYIHGGSNWIGGVVGICYNATVQNVYCEATIVTEGAQIGGIAGRAEGTLDGCWFNGKIYNDIGVVSNVRLGGIVGCTYSGVSSSAPDRTLTVTDCLYTGEISYMLAEEDTTSDAGVGGIIGREAMRNIYVTMENCVSVGVIKCNILKATGSIMGQISTASYNGVESIVVMTNCYGTKDCVPGRTDRELIQSIVSGIEDNVTQTDCALLLTSELQGADIYDNENIKLDYTTWIARSNGSPIPTIFVDWIVPASETVAQPAE